MKCPRCNQQPMSFVQFFLKLNPLNIVCDKCGTTLKAGKLLRSLFIGAVICGSILGIAMAYLSFTYNWRIIHIVLLLIIATAIVGIPAEYIAWKYGRYKVYETADVS
jgi:Na+/citrate or Na+/malate symporter